MLKNFENQSSGLIQDMVICNLGCYEVLLLIR